MRKKEAKVNFGGLSAKQKKMFREVCGYDYVGDKLDGAFKTDRPYNKKGRTSPWWFRYKFEISTGFLFCELSHRMTNNRTFGWNYDGKVLEREIISAVFPDDTILEYDEDITKSNESEGTMERTEFSCDACGKSLETKKQLKDHRKKFHKSCVNIDIGLRPLSTLKFNSHLPPLESPMSGTVYFGSKKSPISALKICGNPFTIAFAFSMDKTKYEVELNFNLTNGLEFTGRGKWRSIGDSRAEGYILADIFFSRNKITLVGSNWEEDGVSWKWVAEISTEFTNGNNGYPDN